MKLPELSTFVINDSTVAFFDTDKDLLKQRNHNSNLKNWVWPMGGVELTFYKDKNYKGEVLDYMDSYNLEVKTMPNGWNDQISSFQFGGVGQRGGLFLYKDANCVGKNVYFEIQRNKNLNPNDPYSMPFINIAYPNLSSIYTGEGFAGLFRPTFNDEISSFKFIIIHDKLD